MAIRLAYLLLLLTTIALGAGACSGGSADDPSDVKQGKVDWGTWTEGECVIPAGEVPDFSLSLGCEDDYFTLASRPLDASIPGARSSKTVIDLFDDGLYFLNADKYPMHYFFCSDHLSVQKGKPPVGDMGSFSNEYYLPTRRFYLGAITFYEEPGVWTYEIAPYDTAAWEVIEESYKKIQEEVFFGDVLYFHPTSATIEKRVPDDPGDVKIITTDELFDGVTFLPLNLGESVGQLRFFEVADLEAETTFVTPRDIAVLDKIPNDIAVVAGIITAELQTPLSHINVLSQNRGTPNMSLVGAQADSRLVDLEGRWVRFKVDAFDFTVEEVDKKTADEWWDQHKPPVVKIPELDLSVTEFRDIENVMLEDIPAFGGKASHYGELVRIGLKQQEEGKDLTLPVPKAFGIPVHFYKQFEKQNGLDVLIERVLSNERFQSDIEFREDVLAALRADVVNSELDQAFEQMVVVKLAEDFPGIRMRFRSSTNAEDLDGFTGAGLYTSKSGDPNDPKRPIAMAIKKVYASLWNLRAFEEREYRGIDHLGVAMALLVHRSFPDEEANGVALTNNIFDEFQPAFYINVQVGDWSVVKPPQGITADQFLYYHQYPGQPTTFLGHSNLVPEGENVLTRNQTHELGQALFAIHQHFAKRYAKPGSFYAMDVEFKFNTELVDVCQEELDAEAELEAGKADAPADGEENEEKCTPAKTFRSVLWVKQARPHPGWGANEN